MTENCVDKNTTSEIVQQFGANPELLVQILQSIVMRYGWIPEETIRQLAFELNLSRADVFGVVNFYHDFRTEAPGRHIVKVCQAEACQAMGSRALTDHARESLGVELHETSDDITLEPVFCLGNCACAPAVMINGRVHGRVDSGRFDNLVHTMKEGS